MLKQLEIEYCPVSTLDAIANMENLEILFMDGIHVKDLSPFTDLKNLKQLAVRDIPTAAQYVEMLKKAFPDIQIQTKYE